MNNKDIQLLKEIWEHFDGIGDGAPDASYAARMALQFSEPLERLIKRAEEQLPEARLGRVWNASDSEFDETVAAIREGR